MSRHVTVELPAASLAQVRAALTALGIAHEVDPKGLPLLIDGGVECGEQPVDIRVLAKPLGLTIDAGLTVREGALELWHSDVDVRAAESLLLEPLRGQLLMSAAERTGLTVSNTSTPRRLRIRVEDDS